MESVKPYWTQYNQTARKSTADKRYKTQAWKAYSESFRRAHPLCAECERKGLVTASTLVDHIIRVNFGGSFHDRTNHQPMCFDCHQDKSFAERNGLSMPYQLNSKGEKVPFDKGGESLIAKYSLPTPQASKSARTVKNQTLFFHGGVLPDLVKKYRYKFPYFFGTTSQIHALKYSQLNKGRMYSFSVVPDLVLEFNGLTNSAEYLALIYEIGESPYKAVRINGCIDFGRTSDFILVTDFTLVKNLIRV